MHNLTIVLPSLAFYSTFFLTFYCSLVSKLLKENGKLKLDRTAIVDVSRDTILQGASGGLVLVVLLIFVAIFYLRKRKEVGAMRDAGLTYFEEGDLDCINPEVALNEQADLLPYNNEYEFPKEKLTILNRLGEGAFGVVVKALAAGIRATEEQTTVAVKTVRMQIDNEAMRALISELKIMVHLGQHLNVVNLLGAVTKNIAKRQLMIIVEYCRFGNVRYFLLKNRPHFVNQVDEETGNINRSMKSSTSTISTSSNGESGSAPFDDNLNTDMSCSSNYAADLEDASSRVITTTDLICWAAQVASGMEYLASRKVLHGDLAARNILLCDGNVVKICDFGLARSMYKYDKYKKKGTEPLPFKWLAPECIGGRVFSTYSDVWAYGIVLWELFTLSEVPYPGMEDVHELYNNLRYGHRMRKPAYANQDIYDIMLSCWNVKPDLRPPFKDLQCRFNAMLPIETRNHYRELNEPYVASNVSKMERGGKDYFADFVHQDQSSGAHSSVPAQPGLGNANGVRDRCIELNNIGSSDFDITLHKNLLGDQTTSKRHRQKSTNVDVGIPLLQLQSRTALDG